jgi:hypothetical protein
MDMADSMLKERGLPGIKTTCLNCGKDINLTIRWAKCAKLREKGFCSLKCSKSWHRIPLECTCCGRTFYRQKCAILRQRLRGFNENGYFCNMACWRTWEGTGQMKMRPRIRTEIGHEFYLGI